MKKILTRLATGLCYVALILLALLYPGSLPFVCIFGLIMIVGLIEFYKLTQPDERKLLRIIDILGGAAIFGSVCGAFYFGTWNLIWVVPLQLYIVVRQILQLYTTSANPINNAAYSFMGFVYVVIPFAVMATIYYYIGAPVLLALFLFLWINDTGAYCVGCTLGKHRLFERVSPKKSWEGFYGGLAFCVIAGIVISVWFNDYFLNYSMWEWIGMALVASIIGTWGDLCESLIKRTLKIKDSGKILPGHGGILDRIDSLLLAAPATLIYFSIINYFK